MNNKINVILAIESAICGGSISLLKDGREIANWIGSSNVSKAEDLLVNIDGILTANNIFQRHRSHRRIGWTRKFYGNTDRNCDSPRLKAGLGVEIASQSALKAMARGKTDYKILVAALPVGRNSICFQKNLPDCHVGLELGRGCRRRCAQRFGG